MSFGQGCLSVLASVHSLNASESDLLSLITAGFTPANLSGASGAPDWWDGFCSHTTCVLTAAFTACVQYSNGLSACAYYRKYASISCYNMCFDFLLVGKLLRLLGTLLLICAEESLIYFLQWRWRFSEHFQLSGYQHCVWGMGLLSLAPNPCPFWPSLHRPEPYSLGWCLEAERGQLDSQIAVFSSLIWNH